jgi:hypothetical protein
VCQRPGIVAELRGAQHPHIGNALNRRGKLIRHVFLITEHGQPLF